jgi:hypothetical protein
MHLCYQTIPIQRNLAAAVSNRRDFEKILNPNAPLAATHR